VPGAEGVLNFRFEESAPARWFAKDPIFDREVQERFGELAGRVLQGNLEDPGPGTRPRVPLASPQSSLTTVTRLPATAPSSRAARSAP
jgi:hypothetical protein